MKSPSSNTSKPAPTIQKHAASVGVTLASRTENKTSTAAGNRPSTLYLPVSQHKHQHNQKIIASNSSIVWVKDVKNAQGELSKTQTSTTFRGAKDRLSQSCSTPTGPCCMPATCKWQRHPHFWLISYQKYEKGSVS